MASTIDIESLRIYRAVVETGSFTAAALRLDKDKAHVSRVVSRLEKKLRVQLLWRSTRRLTVTELGTELYERAVSILNAIEDTENVMAHNQSAPNGVLRITCGTEFGMLKVNNWLSEYMKRYREVRVEAEYTNRLVDIVHEGFDIAIRVGSLPDSDLSARTIGHIHYGLYASEDYLADCGVPETVDELKKHRLIMFSPRRRPKWLLVNGSRQVEIDCEPTCRVNNNFAAREFAADGLGIALLPHFQVTESGESNCLRHILAEWQRSPVAVSAVFSSSRYMTPKVRAFIDLIKNDNQF